MSGQRIADIKLDAFNGASNGGYNGKLNLRLPVGSTYREITMKLVNLLISQVTLITLSLNGDEFMRFSGADLDMLRKAGGVHTTDDRLVIPFTDTTQSTMESQNFSELVTVPGENFVIKVETGERISPAQDNKVAAIELRAKLAPARAARVKLPRLYTDGMNGQRAGEVRYNNFANQNKSGNPIRIQRIFIANPDCSNLILRRNRLDMYDKSLEENNFDLKSNGQVPPADTYLYDATQEGFAATDAVDAVGDFEFVAQLEQAGDFNVMFQTVEVMTRPVPNAAYRGV